MGDNLRRSLINLGRKKEEQLADVRQYYYELSGDKQKQFKRGLESLVVAAKPFERSPLAVEIRYQINLYSGEDSMEIKAILPPAEILFAIKEWDQADDDEKTSAVI